MRGNSRTHIIVVDDDECIRSVARAILTSAHYECLCFNDGDTCLEQLPALTEARKCDLLITDVKMPGKSGMDVLTEALHMAPWLPVIVMTSYADVPMSVQALKAGAYDFIEKPLNAEEFLGVVKVALRQIDVESPLIGKSLTKTERIVLRLILQGMCNRRIAYVLQRSERTIEVHRSHVMQKLGVDNIVDLVKRATAMGFGGEQAAQGT